MKKITTATPEQWAEIAALKARVIASVCEQPDDERVRSVVRKMWVRMGAPPQAIMIFDCPIMAAMAMCVLKSQLRSQLGSQLGSQLDSQLGSQLRSQLGSQLDSQLGSQLRSQLDSQLYSQLDSQLRSQLYSQLYSQLDSQLGSQLRSQLGSQLDSQLYSQLDSQLDSQLYSQLGSQLDSQLDSQLGSQLRSQLDSQLGSQLRSQLDSQLGNLAKENYVSIWWRAWSGWYEGGKILGVDFDSEKYDLFIEWTQCVPVIITNRLIPIVSRLPEQCHWKDGRLHNEHGMSVRLRSGWGLWTIDGIPVDEQIVMRPETQTIKQIDSEKNADVKSIRITRFGWPRYLKESGAKEIDSRHNDLEGTEEALFQLPDGETKLLATCPTGRPFVMGVGDNPGQIQTCEQAQRWIHRGRIMLSRT